MIKKKAKTVETSLHVMRCPNKKHRGKTSILVGGEVDGFYKFGCSCAIMLILRDLKSDEKRAENTRLKKVK